MKKNKIARPRRGIKFSRAPQGGAAGSFVGSGPAIQTAFVTGSVMVSAVADDSVSTGHSPLVSSRTVVNTSLTQINSRSTRIVNANLLGIENGGIGRTSAVCTPQSSSIPSWTNEHIENSAFVIKGFGTGSTATSLNYVFDGTESLEQSGMTSVERFTAKSSNLQTITVKHTASFFDTVPRLTGTVPSTFTPLTGVLCSTVTGSRVPAQISTVNNPATIYIDVPQNGRLVDIKVWVELTHQSGSADRRVPLGELCVTLRNPNVSFAHAHPIYNDPTFIEQANKGDAFKNIYKSSFILWEGGGVGPDGGAAYPGPNGDENFVPGFDSSKYPTWEKDRSMRTRFSDGAPVPNPRRLRDVSPSFNWNGAPNAYDDGTNGFFMNVASGNNVPWTSDGTSLTVADPTTYLGPGSPPRGWLGGLGGTPMVNEWPTTGVNYGAADIQPVYPLLDSIFVKKRIGNERKFAGFGPTPPLRPEQWRGVRPGLRGAEISGTWELMICNNTAGSTAANVMPLYFKQARLEITYSTEPTTFPVDRKGLTKLKASRDDAEVSLYSISGSDDSGLPHLDVGCGADYFRTEIYSIRTGGPSRGRTFGLVLNSGSIGQPDCALLYKLSGSLADLSGSAPGWLMNNAWNMPVIPLSSASLVAPSGTFTAPPPTPLYPPKRLDGPRKLGDVARSINPPLNRAKLAQLFVSSSAT